ncbi:MAG TPA: hypothetical protein ENN12_04165 [Epsilonproteobacteria bacterium]|nr:hypothetical protein [Campylobacterota bacterium]
MPNELIQTDDGTFTLYSLKYDECYHSKRDGALSESLYKHVVPAFSQVAKRDKISILDICFGLGYNTLATIYYCKLHGIITPIEIVSPELDMELVRGLGKFAYPKEFEPFLDIIDQLSQNLYYKDGQFEIKILIGDARDLLPNVPKKFDIIYQDAFSSKKNMALWTLEYFQQLHKLSNPNTILTTYSSATSVRMGLWESGFLLYKPKDMNVRSGTIASISPLDLEPIDMVLKCQRNRDARSLRDSDLA